jgi:uncharacterized membrane protein YeiB
LKRLSVGGACLGAFHCTLSKIGDFLREAAVLGLVFIPIDLWRNSQVPWEHLTIFGLAVIVTFAFGVFFEWTSLGVKYAKQIWEEKEVSP